MSLVRFLLLPLAALYNALTGLRNHMYNIGSRKSFRFEPTVICVGNLSAGGSGKTPMVEYLADWLGSRYETAILSRGYGRSTRGFRHAGPDDDARSIGDESFQMYRKFGNRVLVAVGEDRALAIPEILFRRSQTQIILLDDAFQHRRVLPDISILLTSWQRPFYSDYLLPAGMLRESRSNASRAGIVVITKCPEGISDVDMDFARSRIAAYAGESANVFFAGIQYLAPRPLFCEEPHEDCKEAFLFTGIAQPEPLLNYVEKHYRVCGMRRFRDHKPYSLSGLVQSVLKPYRNQCGGAAALITTEKDAVRILRLPGAEEMFKDIPFYYVPVKMKFLTDEALFKEIILRKVRLTAS